MHRVDKLFIVFIIFYSLFIVNRVDAGYLAADEGAHGMTAVFYNKFISNFLSDPVGPSVLYDYVKAYYVRYPKFSFIYGPIYPVTGALLFFFLPTTQFVSKLLTVFFGFIALLFSVYLYLKIQVNSMEGSLVNQRTDANARPQSLRVTVTVTGPSDVVVRLDGYRTRYAPNALP